MSIRKLNRIKRKQNSLTSARAHWCNGCDANLVHGNEKCSRCGRRPVGDQVKKRDYYYEESYEIPS